MSKETPDRRKEILQAALREFINEGVSGARTQAIADNIGVTKAMIHYYFKTKENLFREAFRFACNTVMNDLMNELEKPTPIFQKIESFIDQASDRFENYPKLVGFIISELNRHTELTEELFRASYEYDATVLSNQLEEAAANYEITPVNPRQVVGNVLSLCMFPYAGRGFVKSILLIEDEKHYKQFLTKRREVIKDTIINWLAG